MRFTAPLVLLLLLLLPVIAAVGWPRRGFGRQREAISLGLRLALMLSLVLALAGMETVRATDELAVVFLLDVSDSMPASSREAAENYLRQALAEMGPNDQAAVIVFGGDALVERPMSPGRELGPITSTPRTNQTDLGEAIRLGLALYPPDTSRRMVILSDGAATTGDPLAAAELAGASGVEIVAIPFEGGDRGPEAMLTSVEAPARLLPGERFDLQLTVDSTQATGAVIRVLAGGQVIYEGSHELQRGVQSFSLPLAAGESAEGGEFFSYEVQIEPEDDQYYQNNALSGYANIQGPPRILLVSPPPGETISGFGGDDVRPDEAAQLLQALQQANFQVETALPASLPSDLVGLAQYATVVLVDVPARDLSQRQMLSLQSYVRDLGGGLVAVGGPTSYGVGGYFRTPLEETLPVEMQIKDELRRPTISIVFIIDHSGSMSETSGGVSKLDMAKEAVIRSVDLLFPTDRIGVIAFDESASWVVPMTEIDNPGAVKNAVGSIRLGGGTDIMAGVQAMARVLPDDPANIKHVVLLTDGGADPTGIPELVAQLKQDSGITLTTVGVGRDAAPFLPQLAEAGGGRYHFAADPSTIPFIFTEETTLATRAYLVERSFFPQLASASPILSGIHEVPPLHGYVATSSKNVARTILVSDEGDPILASWQYGLGKAVAFTSDASGRWGRDWVRWQNFAPFWAQVVSFSLAERVGSGLDVRVEHQDETAQLVVNAQTEAGEYLNDYTLLANVVSPDGEVQTLELRQVAPGRYQAPFLPGEVGAYLIGISGQAPQGAGSDDAQMEAVGETTGWVMSYSPEYRNLEIDRQAFCRLDVNPSACENATRNPEVTFAHTLEAGQATRPAWPWLLALAALLLPLDVAVRRLVVTPEELRRGWAKLAARLGGSRGTGPSQPERSARIDSLMQAKQRARESKESGQVVSRIPESAPPPVTGAHSAPPSPPQEAPPRQEAPASKEATDPARPQPVVPPKEKAEDKSASTAASLLAAKRERKKGKQ